MRQGSAAEGLIAASSAEGSGHSIQTAHDGLEYAGQKPLVAELPPTSRCPSLAQGSVWGTTFNMCAAILGAGALSLPHTMHAMGVVPGVVLLMFTAVATHYSVVLLISAYAPYSAHMHIMPRLRFNAPPTHAVSTRLAQDHSRISHFTSLASGTHGASRSV